MSPPYSGPAPRTVKRHSAIVTSSTKKPGSLLPGSSGYAVDDLAHSFIIHRTSGSPASHHLTAQPHRKSAHIRGESGRLPAWEMDEEEDVELKSDTSPLRHGTLPSPIYELVPTASSVVLPSNLDSDVEAAPPPGGVPTGVRNSNLAPKPVLPKRSSLGLPAGSAAPRLNLVKDDSLGKPR